MATYFRPKYVVQLRQRTLSSGCVETYIHFCIYITDTHRDVTSQEKSRLYWLALYYAFNNTRTMPTLLRSKHKALVLDTVVTYSI